VVGGLSAELGPAFWVTNRWTAWRAVRKIIRLGEEKVKIDTSLPPVGLRETAAIACAAEELGFGAVWTTETMHDPFLPAVLIATATSHLQFGTAVAIAFARSPATLAYTAWDLARVSSGRFILGLGTQVKAHVERRFGLPWPESPVKKLREQITAIRAFWNTWQTGEPLNVEGEYYNLNLMSPFFNPGPIDHPKIPIYIAGVNPGMARLAGETADGFHVHPFHTPRYLREVLLPAIHSGAARSGRSAEDIKISVTAFAAVNQGEKDFVRFQVAFYASTPSYRPVMALHGWEETAGQLSRLAARGKWDEMSALISDEMLDAFVAAGSAEDLRDALLERYQGLATRLTLYMPFIPGDRDSFWKTILGQKL
jgi:probable F420-dependent oxidoreductase